MILSDRDIQAAIAAGKILVDPIPDVSRYDSVSLNLRIGEDPARRWRRDLVGNPGVVVTLDLTSFNYKKLEGSHQETLPLAGDGGWVLQPGDFVLVKTLERIGLPLGSKISGRIEGRSTPARLGVTAHVTAPIIHAGFEGRIELEIVNHGPFAIKFFPKKTSIAQVVFERVSSLPTTGGKSVHQHQK